MKSWEFLYRVDSLICILNQSLLRTQLLLQFIARISVMISRKGKIETEGIFYNSLPFSFLEHVISRLRKKERI